LRKYSRVCIFGPACPGSDIRENAIAVNHKGSNVQNREWEEGNMRFPLCVIRLFKRILCD